MICEMCDKECVLTYRNPELGYRSVCTPCIGWIELGRLIYELPKATGYYANVNA